MALITPILWSEFRINPASADLQTGVQLQALKEGDFNGGFMSLWQEGPEEKATAIYLQRFYAGGVPQDSAFDGVKINTTPGTIKNPVFAELSNGNIVVAWQHYDSKNENVPYTIRARVFDDKGNPIDMDGDGDPETGTGDFEVAGGTTDFANPSIMAIANGGFVIAYENGGDDSDVIAAVYHDGTTAGDKSEIEINSVVFAGKQAISTLVSLETDNSGTENFLAFYTDEGTSSDGTILRARFFSTTTSSVSPKDDVAIGNIDSAVKGTTPAVTMLGGVNKGKILVSWTEQVGDSTDVKMQVFTVNASTGNLDPDGDVLTVNRVTTGNQDSPAVTALSNGGFAISYVDSSNIEDGPQVRVAVFGDDKEHVLVEDTILNANWVPAKGRTAPSLIELEDGRLIAAWNETSESRDDTDGGIWARVIDARTNPIDRDGTSETDQWVATQFGDTLNGAGGDDHLNGYGGNDILDGGIGRDVLNGGVGADRMIGGGGDDTYYVDDTGDVLVEYAGGGTDTIYVSYATSSYTLAAEMENLVVTNSSSVTLTGNAVNNSISGSSGNDTIDGGLGADTMSGSIGNDTYTVDNAGDQVVEGAGGGVDTVYVSGVSYYALANEVENLFVTSGSSATLVGNAVNNSISGNSGNDAIDGGLGADIMSGSSGNDTYKVDNVGDQVVESAGGGTDTVIAMGSYTLGANVENLTAEGFGAFSLTGNGAANVITGNGDKNTIRGGSGNDTLTGGTGKDFFVFDTKLGTAKTDRKVNFDKISDFNVKDDTLWLDNKYFKKLGKKGSEKKPAKLKKDFFTIGTEAQDANDYLIYNKKKGVLYYDQDGSGSKAAVEIAQLSKKLKLTYKDFFVI